MLAAGVLQPRVLSHVIHDWTEEECLTIHSGERRG
jgi:hypothetical protein